MTTAFLPWWVRALNATGRVLAAAAWQPPHLSDDALLREASRRTQLTDFGDDAFRPWLRRLVVAINKAPDITLLGRLILRRRLLAMLTNRLKIAHEVARHPDIAAIEVRQPVFVVGFPRTGTTLLHNLLACDPRARAPLLWELARPAPAPEPTTYDTDPRIREVEHLLASFHRLVPDGDRIHALRARQPEECYYLLENAFFSASFAQLLDLPDYWRALREHAPADADAAYAYYRLQLQILTARMPGNWWVSKSPVHLLALDALLRTFPDARVIVTHRDPLQCIPSACSLVQSVRRLFVARLDPAAIGRLMLDTYRDGERRVANARAAQPGAAITDVHYDDLVADPLGTLHRLQHTLALPRSVEWHGRAQRWLADNPQNKYGEHRYSLEQFGLSASAVRSVA